MIVDVEGVRIRDRGPALDQDRMIEQRVLRELVLAPDRTRERRVLRGLAQDQTDGQLALRGLALAQDRMSEQRVLKLNVRG